MKYRPRWLLLAFGAAIVAVLFTYPTWRKLIPTRGLGGPDYALASDAQRAVFADMRKTPGADPAAAYNAMLITVVAPAADAPTPDPSSLSAIRSGDFVPIDAVHTASGHVTLYRKLDNSLLLRFDDFSVINGPHLTVYLSTAALPKTAAEMTGTNQLQVFVGTLKGTSGNQNYTGLPPELDLSRYKSVVLYSEDLKAVYSSATLQ